MRKLAGLFIVTLIMFFSFSSMVLAAPTVIMDGQVVSFDMPPVIQDGTTLVPMRAIFESLGATVEWDSAKWTATATRSGNRIVVTIGKPSVWINGDDIPVNVPPQIINETTMIPLRVISEGLGAVVEWDGATKTITITGPLRDDATLSQTTFEHFYHSQSPLMQHACDAKATRDGGYIVVGDVDSHITTKEDAGVVRKAEGNILIIKVNQVGEIQWEKTFGEKGYNTARSVQCTYDGGYILAGSIAGIDESLGAIIKLDDTGQLQWIKTYKNCSHLYCVSIADDGGFVLAGRHYHNGGRIIKTDDQGNLEWMKSVEISPSDWVGVVSQTKDNGYIAAGNTFDSDNKCYPFILRLNAKGDISWFKTLSNSLMISSLQPANDGGLIAAGKYNNDALIMKLDQDGSIIWQKTYGGTKSEWAYCAIQTSDGGFIAAGQTDSYGPGWDSGYIIKLNANGYKIWQKTIGTGGCEYFESIQQARDGGYILAGVVSYSHVKFYLVKTDASGNVYYR